MQLMLFYALASCFLPHTVTTVTTDDGRMTLVIRDADMMLANTWKATSLLEMPFPFGFVLRRMYWRDEDGAGWLVLLFSSFPPLAGRNLLPCPPTTHLPHLPMGFGYILLLLLHSLEQTRITETFCHWPPFLPFLPDALQAAAKQVLFRGAAVKS